METTRDNGKEHGDYYIIKGSVWGPTFMETTIIWQQPFEPEKSPETRGGHVPGLTIGIMEKKMKTTIMVLFRA